MNSDLQPPEDTDVAGHMSRGKGITSDEPDVEGHGARPTHIEPQDSDDVEGHTATSKHFLPEEPDVEGHGARATHIAPEDGDDDVDGHMSRGKG